MSTNPTLTPAQQDALNTDAKNRAVRTFIQSLAIDVIMALALVLVNVFNDAQGWSDIDWAALGFLLVKTILVSAASYVMRRFLDPSAKVPTPVPPPTLVATQQVDGTYAVEGEADTVMGLDVDESDEYDGTYPAELDHGNDGARDIAGTPEPPLTPQERSITNGQGGV